jgi:hypothetical protein
MSDLCVEYHNYPSNVSVEDSVACMQGCLASRQSYDLLDLTQGDCSHPVTVILNMYVSLYVFHNDNQTPKPPMLNVLDM